MILKVRLREEGTARGVEGVARPAGNEDLLLWAQWRYREQDLDKGWRWKRIFEDCRRSRGRLECHCLVAADQMQGLMVLNLRGKTLDVERGRGMVVDYLAANPANRPSFGRQKGRLQGAGLGLLAVAIERSKACGMSGRLWLESLPDQNTRQFYENRGFVATGKTTAKGNGIYNLASETSRELLKTLKEKGVIER